MFILTNVANSGRVQAINMERVERLYTEEGKLRAELPEQDALLGKYADDERAEAVLLEVMQAYTTVYAPVLDIKLSPEELVDALAEQPMLVEANITQNVMAVKEQCVFKLPEE